MKRIIAFLLSLVLLLGCVGCAAPHSCENVCESCGLCLALSCQEAVCQEKCQGHHTSCVSVCYECGLCGNKDCTEDVCREKCQGHTGVFSPTDDITTEDVSVDTGTFVYDIGAGIYVRGDLQEITDVVVPLMEQVSGLDFDGAGYARQPYPDGKIHITVSRSNLYAGQDWYQGSNDSEVGSAFASAWSHVSASPGDLYLMGDSAIVHEASHVLMYRQSEWNYSQLLNEGISTYTTYLVERELEKTAPQIGYFVGCGNQSISNMRIYDYNKLYEQPLEYWFENTFEYSGNANYVIGFRFMAYLQEVYGNYTGWITKFEEMYPYTSNRSGTDIAPVDRQIQVLKATYGEDVLDNFYPWLKENQARFEEDYGFLYDLTGVRSINLYPTCNAVETRVKMENFKYNNLYINLETARAYLADYKNMDISGMTLYTSSPVNVALYRTDGTCVTVKTNTEIPLDDVSYIKLLDEGTLNLLEIQGPFRYVG